MPESSLLPASMNRLRQLSNVVGELPYSQHVSATPMFVERDSTMMPTLSLADHRLCIMRRPPPRGF